MHSGAASAIVVNPDLAHVNRPVACPESFRIVYAIAALVDRQSTPCSPAAASVGFSNQID